MPSAQRNEWALWKKGLRPCVTTCFCCAFFIEWMSLMEKRIETGLPISPLLARLNKEWMSLMEKRIETLICGCADLALLSLRMNEPYGKKDWDLHGFFHRKGIHRLEWMSLMEKRIETLSTLIITGCWPIVEWMSLMEKRIETSVFFMLTA